MSLWETVMLFGLAPWAELALAFLLEVILGKPRFLRPDRCFGAIVKKLTNAVRISLGRNPRANHRTRAIVLCVVVPLVTAAAVWGGAVALNMTLGMAASSLYRVLLMYLALSFHREFFAAMRVSALLKKGDKEKARKALSAVTDKDTDKMSEQGLVRTSCEETGRAVSEGGLLPILYGCFGMLVFTPYGGRLTAALMWAAVAMYCLLRSCEVDFDNRPQFTAALRSVSNIVTNLPSRLLALLTAALSFVLRLGYKDSLTQSVIASRIIRDYGRGVVYGSLSGSLGIRLGGGGYYSGAWKSSPNIGADRMPPSRRELKQSVLLMSLVLLIGATICVISPVAATISALMLHLVAMRPIA